MPAPSEFPILLSSAGRRVGLLRCIRDGLLQAGLPGRIHATDVKASAPALHTADVARLVPPCRDESFIPSMLDLTREYGIRLVIPTIDTELAAYAGASDQFQALGATVAVSLPHTIAICGDKVSTHQWLSSHGFPTVAQLPAAEACADPGILGFPLIVKPRGGSASAGVAQVNSLPELQHYSALRADLIAQQIAPGDEYTVNVYVNRAGKCIAAVPHHRIETRAGEVSKGVTVRRTSLIDLARTVAESLPGAWGPLNIQMFLASDDSIRIIEMNARFGGGYPLTHHAGAPFTRWLIQEVLGEHVTGTDEWQSDLAMLRFDDAVYLPAAQLSRT